MNTIKTEDKNKIKQGYKKTPVGIIPEDWEVKRFTELAKRNSERFDPTSGISKKDLELDSFEQGTGRILNIYDSRDYRSSKNVFKKGDVLFGKLRPYLKKYWKATFDGVCSSEIWVFQNKESILSDYLYLTLQTEYFINKSQITSGTKMPRAEWSSVKNAKLPIPPLPEQTAIADCLSTWDKGIEKLSALIASKKEQKKGLMQQLLTGKKRLDGFTEEWKEVSIKDMGEVSTGNTPSKADSSNWGDEFPWVTAEDMNNKYVFNTEVKLSNIGKKKARIASKGSLLITCIASIGKNSIVAVDSGFNQQINAITVNSKHNNEFLFYLIDFLVHKLIRYASPGALKILNKSTFEKIKYLVPSLKEQNAIAEVLTAADKEIELLEQKLEAFKIQKKGLMQVLLTGALRLCSGTNGLVEN